tara:strand:+ start:8018 stop:8419 length:402 start_codon:yes stop_codon:yes gene_type:complete
MKAYIAGLLGTKESQAKLEEIDRLCKELEIDTFLPHRDAGVYDGKKDPMPIFKRDRDEVEICDFMIALLDWKGIGSGTAWELGYAHAKGKKVIGIVEDKRTVKDVFRICVMCFNSIKLIEIDELKKELINLKG